MKRLITLVTIALMAMGVSAEHETMFDVNTSSLGDQIQWNTGWASTGNNGGLQRISGEYVHFAWRGAIQTGNPVENLGVGDTLMMSVKFFMQQMTKQNAFDIPIYQLVPGNTVRANEGGGQNGTYTSFSDKSLGLGVDFKGTGWQNPDGGVIVSHDMGTNYTSPGTEAEASSKWGLTGAATAPVDGDTVLMQFMAVKSSTVNEFTVSLVVTNLETDETVISKLDQLVTHQAAYEADSLFFTTFTGNLPNGCNFSIINMKLEKYPAPTMPSVSIDSPVDGTTFVRGSSVTVTATATPNATSNSPIQTVVLNDGLNNYTMTNTSGNEYAYTFTTVLGTHNLTVTATDQAGKITAVSDVTITMQEPSYSGGTGVVGDEYIIASASDLQDLSGYEGHWGKEFIITSDIDMNGKTFTPIGYQGKEFTGNIDGQGSVISNLTITDLNTSGANGIGLIGYSVGSVIENLGINGVITNYPNDERVAPFIGYGDGVTISSCYADNINITGSYRVGGIGGWIKTGSTITNCWADGAIVSGASWKYGGGIAGIVEDDSTDVSNCAFYGTLSGGTNMGGIVGSLGSSVNDVSNIISNCYFINTAGDTRAYAGATAKTDAELKVEGTYSGFDFTNIWVMDTYASLKVFIDIPTNVSEAQVSKISIYPTLVSSSLNLSETVNELAIFNLNGQLVKSAFNTNSVDVSGLTSGMYLLKVNQEVVKFVKQ